MPKVRALFDLSKLKCQDAGLFVAASLLVVVVCCRHSSSDIKVYGGNE